VVDVQQGLTYWSDDEVSLEGDACVPGRSPDRVPAVVIVHGGGFTSGDRADDGMRSICKDLAREGTVGFSIDYRLAPDFTYPAQVDDLAHAVEWLREPAQIERFGIDPGRIGVLGSSAGAIMAQSLATRGSGPLTRGDRVAAVVSLSGVSVMTPDAWRLGAPSPRAAQLVLGYLGCRSVASCPQTVPASPITAVDPSDSPMLLVNGTDELVPRQQADAMAAALSSAEVPAQVVIVDAPHHGIALLNADVRRSVRSFLEEYL
jgi:acetyl esterase/lipase